ncbi:MAG: RNA 2',3'-cyclic phosphodiesterase [Nanoarchaeota archaeon]|nr:RNA 2',3'-cyclic phosphodiesterase [Nanoarchaeota archaeon]MBU1631591.1 RNA 2',3'-cyclic phosphodiesterase [Nanoarchaeota archaeon]MBU1875481.1 RNA 2',3'-cyclic phosphodiesterase [Nanoarchaeota archaeon]
MKRLFVAVPVSLSIKEKIKPFYKKLKETGADFNFVSLENLHFTLKFLGDVNEGKIESIKDILLKIKQEHFSISLEKIGVFPNLERINVVWIGIKDSKLISLMKQVDELLNYIRKNEHQTEIPHLTIARVKSGKNKELLQNVLAENKDLDFGEMVVDKFILYESELTSEGPVYNVLEEIMLG